MRPSRSVFVDGKEWPTMPAAAAYLKVTYGALQTMFCVSKKRGNAYSGFPYKGHTVALGEFHVAKTDPEILKERRKAATQARAQAAEAGVVEKAAPKPDKAAARLEEIVKAFTELKQECINLLSQASTLNQRLNVLSTEFVSIKKILRGARP